MNPEIVSALADMKDAMRNMLPCENQVLVKDLVKHADDDPNLKPGLVEFQSMHVSGTKQNSVFCGIENSSVGSLRLQAGLGLGRNLNLALGPSP